MERLTKKRTDNGQYYLNGLAEVHNSYPDGFGRIQVGCAIDKLAEYEDLEEQGKLLKLPCAVGDTVYVKMQFGGYAEAEVRDFTYFTSYGFCIVVTSKSFNKQNIPFSEFGKTVFLTKPEAEAKLAEMEGKK